MGKDLKARKMYVWKGKIQNFELSLRRHALIFILYILILVCVGILQSSSVGLHQTTIGNSKPKGTILVKLASLILIYPYGLVTFNIHETNIYCLATSFL